MVEPDQGNGPSAIQVNTRRTQGRRADFDVVLSHIISQLRPGADLSRVVLPTFILEPRSMLERITKYAGPNLLYHSAAAIGGSEGLTNRGSFMCHPEMLLPIPQIEDPVERFVAVVKFYLSGWHIRPP